jgi:hypothetical protein
VHGHAALVPHHHYPLLSIWLFIRIILHCAVSLRATSRLLGLLSFVSLEQQVSIPGLSGTPTPQCGRQWLLRLGLYELSRPKERADDWAWIADHTIQLGETKILIIVGIRLSSWNPHRGPISHKDLAAIAVDPTSQSNGSIVESQLNEGAEVTGDPRLIVRDDGPDLKKGVNQFVESHPGTVSVYDIKHMTARIVKRELESDPRWPEFSKHVDSARKQSHQTPVAHLAPPTIQTQARYMNVHKLIRWGAKVRAYLDNPIVPEDAKEHRGKINLTFGWLREYDQPLREWNGVIDVAAEAIEAVRQDGYYRGAAEALQPRLAELAHNPPAQRVADHLVEFVAAQSTQAREGEHLIGCTEVIESLIGKAKQLEGDQRKGGFTRMILGIAASVANPAMENVRKALETVKTADVAKWATEHLGPTVQAMRRKAFSRAPEGTNSG